MVESIVIFVLTITLSSYLIYTSRREQRLGGGIIGIFKKRNAITPENAISVKNEFAQVLFANYFVNKRIFKVTPEGKYWIDLAEMQTNIKWMRTAGLATVIICLSVLIISLIVLASVLI